MTKPRKLQFVKAISEERELDEIDALFKELEKDKSLPTFGEHFMYCLMFNIGRNVDLMKLYPKTYKKLNRWLNKHNQQILEAKK